MFYGNICKTNAVYSKIVRMTHVHHTVTDRFKFLFCFNDTEYFEENLCRTITAYHQDTCIGQFYDLHFTQISQQNSYLVVNKVLRYR